MYLSDCILNDSEIKTRWHWLVSTFCFLILCPIAVCFAMVPHWAALWFLAIVGLLKTLLIRHCVYRKYGTKLLTLWLFVSPFNELASIPLAVGGVISGEWTIFTIAMIEIAVFLWWYWMSVKVRTINKTIRKRKTLLA